MKLYLVGSLRNSRIPKLGAGLRAAGHEVFDDWFAPGPRADDFWRQYEKKRGRSYREALNGYAATHVFDFDRSHIDRADAGILVAPAGKSAHLELGYMIGRGQLGYVLFAKEPARWDIMYKFAHGIFFNPAELLERLEWPAHQQYQPSMQLSQSAAPVTEISQPTRLSRNGSRP